MKILFVGLGSIGQRHLQNIIFLQKKIEKIIGERLVLYNLKSGKKLRRVISNGLVTGGSFQDYYKINTIYDLVTAKKLCPDVVFVTNPSSFHIKTALTFALLGSNLFIEKPLGSRLTGVSHLIKTINDKRLINMVGYQTRFNPVVNKVKNYINKNRSKLIAASFRWHTYLPSHHRYENYSKGYAARRSLGGGVILGLIHEIDLLYFLLGVPKNALAVGGKFSKLDMNVEDTTKILMEYSERQNKFLVDLSLSYCQTFEQRDFILQFEKTTVIVDLIKNVALIYNKNGNLYKKITTNLSRNELFQREIIHFFRSIAKHKKTICDVEEALVSLNLALEFKNLLKQEKPKL